MTRNVIVSLYLALTTSVLAVAPGQSESSFLLDGATLTGQASFAWEDIDSVLSIDLNRDGKLDSRELEESQLFLGEYGATLFHCHHEEAALKSVNVAWHYNSEAGTIEFDYQYEADRPMIPETTKVEFVGYRDFPVGHQQALKVLDVTGKVLSNFRAGDAKVRPLFPEPIVASSMKPHLLVERPAALSIRVADESRASFPMIFLSASVFVIVLTVCLWIMRRMGVIN